MQALRLLLCGAASALALLMAPATGAAEFPGEPPLQTPQAKLDAALHCPAQFVHTDKPPVLLVHGTFTRGREQYMWNYIPLLGKRGFDVCTVTYPDRGLGDQQISAEYVVNALRTIHAETGRKVAMIGHSQGASMPRWALKYWPSARNAVSDFVMIAGPNHGTLVSSPADLEASLGVTDLLSTLNLGLLPAAFFQFGPNSNFVHAVNSGDETPGDIDYTSIYGRYDELVQPAAPVPTAALDWHKNNPHVSNILLQDVCPGYLVDHVLIGTTDALAFKLALDAISKPGPADVKRAGGPSKLCGLLPLLPTENITAKTVFQILAVLPTEGADSIPNPHLVPAEPPLKPYAQQ